MGSANQHQPKVGPKGTQAAGRPRGNRGSGLRRERLPQGSSEGGAGWENLRIKLPKAAPAGRDERERTSQIFTNCHEWERERRHLLRGARRDRKAESETLNFK